MDMPKVSIQSAGDHFFDIDHIRREGGEELLESLLEKANYSGEWKARVEKKLSCGAHTPPLAVVGYKPWGVYIKIKPGDNNTCHYCTLLMASGFTGEKVFNSFKDKIKSINRNWRKGEREDVAPSIPLVHHHVLPIPIVKEEKKEENPVLVESLPMKQPVEEITFKTLKGIAKNGIKLGFVLKKIQEICSLGITKSKKDFVEMLQKACNWEPHKLNAVGRVVFELCKFNYLLEVRNDRNKIKDYCLTKEGLNLVGKEEVKQQRKHVETIDKGQFIIQFREKAQEIADAGLKLESNRKKYLELEEEMKKLNSEYQEIVNLISQNSEIKKILGE